MLNAATTVINMHALNFIVLFSFAISIDKSSVS
jgi:hypothetical protein